EESQIYFDKRPLLSRLSAIISAQSKVTASRRELEGRLKEVEKEFAGRNPPVPDFWGGYRVWPERMEFWQGRENRLHDRFLYMRQSDNSWRVDRLSP
ncbi:MAG TPA: pyridoxine 5'-phosphate oxidase C-terminal domain-containing protein, partial [Chthoniobacterales bacterium]|nr:pyridoxine 5'-phosphate oxidase C-terminal domain-containing protein [Chthoniobacterales bacterium]